MDMSQWILESWAVLLLSYQMNPTAVQPAFA